MLLFCWNASPILEPLSRSLHYSIEYRYSGYIHWSAYLFCFLVLSSAMLQAERQLAMCPQRNRPVEARREALDLCISEFELRIHSREPADTDR